MQASIRQRSWHGLEMLASYTLGSAKTNNRGYYGGGAVVASEGAYWLNAYDSEAEFGPAFHDVRHNFVLSANYDLPFGSGRTWGIDWSGVTNALLGGWKAGDHLPGADRDSPSPSMTAARGRCRASAAFERPNCVGNPVPSDQSITTSGSTSTRFSAAALGTFGDCGIGIVDAPGYTNVDCVLSKRFDAGGASVPRVPGRDLQPDQHPELRAPGARHLGHHTFGLITTTVSSPRVVELVAKFFF